MILFDYKIFFLQKYGGISRYVIELCKKLETNNINYFIQANIHQNVFLKQFNTKKSQNFYFENYPRYSRKLISFLNNFYLKKKIKNSNIDIIHNTYYGNINSEKINVVTSVYDFIHEIYSNEYGFKKNIKKKAIYNSDFFICISENTKKDLINYYNIPEEKIGVTYLGGDHLPKPNFYFKEKPFILYVGSRKNYKNFEILLNAFYQSDKLKKDFNIICYGDNSFDNEELDSIRKYGLSNNVKYLTGNEQLLSNLYNSAKCHVITSKYEGFGITAVEAYNFECPVIYNNTSSLKEIGPNLGKYDNSSDNLAFAMENILYSEDLLKKIINEGNFLKKKFNWENCYNQTIKIYKKINNKFN